MLAGRLVLSPQVLGFGRVLVGVGKRDGTERDVEVDLPAFEVEDGLAAVEVEEGLAAVEVEEDLVATEVAEGLEPVEIAEGREVVERLPGVDGLEDVTEAELVFKTEVLLLLEKELLE